MVLVVFLSFDPITLVVMRLEINKKNFIQTWFISVSELGSILGYGDIPSAIFVKTNEHHAFCMKCIIFFNILNVYPERTNF
jgi:hypothetical protein